MPINNETRKDPKIAREVLERLLPDAGARKSCLRFLCDSIQLAHQLAPGSWGLTLQKDLVRLNVGHIEVMTFEHDRIHVVFDRDTKPRDLGTIPDVHIGSKTPVYKSVKSSSSCNFPASKATGILPLIRESHHQLIKQAVETPRNNMTARAHSPGVLRYLEEEVGIHLPKIRKMYRESFLQTGYTGRNANNHPARVQSYCQPSVRVTDHEPNSSCSGRGRCGCRGAEEGLSRRRALFRLHRRRAVWWKGLV